MNVVGGVLVPVDASQSMALDAIEVADTDKVGDAIVIFEGAQISLATLASGAYDCRWNRVWGRLHSG